jgi:hypothetical protein
MDDIDSKPYFSAFVVSERFNAWMKEFYEDKLLKYTLKMHRLNYRCSVACITDSSISNE